MRYEWRGQKPLDRFDAMKAFISWADEIGPVVRSALKERTPVVTGRMKESERYARNGFAGGVRLEFTAYTRYAQWVIGGARPHIIRPRAARALHWTNAGGSHFASVVHHPGNKPNDFPKEVLESLKDQITKSLKDHIDAAIKGNES
jgi:hypothetical protein